MSGVDGAGAAGSDRCMGSPGVRYESHPMLGSATLQVTLRMVLPVRQPPRRPCGGPGGTETGPLDGTRRAIDRAPIDRP